MTVSPLSELLARLEGSDWGRVSPEVWKALVRVAMAARDGESLPSALRALDEIERDLVIDRLVADGLLPTDAPPPSTAQEPPTDQRSAADVATREGADPDQVGELSSATAAPFADPIPEPGAAEDDAALLREVFRLQNELATLKQSKIVYLDIYERWQAALVDARRWNQAREQPEAMSHLLLLLAQGKGTKNKLDELVDKIIMQRARCQAARGRMAADPIPEPPTEPPWFRATFYGNPIHADPPARAQEPPTDQPAAVRELAALGYPPGTSYASLLVPPQPAADPILGGCNFPPLNLYADSPMTDPSAADPIPEPGAEEDEFLKYLNRSHDPDCELNGDPCDHTLSCTCSWVERREAADRIAALRETIAERGRLFQESMNIALRERREAESECDRLREENQSLRAECGIRQIQGYHEGKKVAEAARKPAALSIAYDALVAHNAKIEARCAELEQLLGRAWPLVSPHRQDLRDEIRAAIDAATEREGKA